MQTCAEKEKEMKIKTLIKILAASCLIASGSAIAQQPGGGGGPSSAPFGDGCIETGHTAGTGLGYSKLSDPADPNAPFAYA